MSDPYWLNLYPGYEIDAYDWGPYESRAAADDGADEDRIACIKVTPKPTRKP